ncbi:MAG: beta-galactosidase, partial [Turicibacter sp.]
MKITIKDKQILVDGQPELIMSGEIHYYRVQREDWEDRIIKLKESGCNTVATYIPWICHNPIEGEMDLEGSTRPELDLGGFIDLCAKHNLMCFLRPGPFIMAEMKNEGIPSWIYAKHQEIIPVGWDGGKPTTPTLDYLAPNFLMEVKKWYEAVMTLISSRLCTKGGNVISVQLDNEIGMLSWVSNVPDLTDYLLISFKDWLFSKYSMTEVATRYPFSFNDFDVYSQAIRSPRESYSLELFKDLGYYMRHRFAIYIKTLRLYAEEYGVKDIPFVVNI